MNRDRSRKRYESGLGLYLRTSPPEPTTSPLLEKLVEDCSMENADVSGVMYSSRRQSKPGPLTPAKTPPSDAFELTSPKSITFESSFHDPRVTWDTANPCSSSPQEITTPKSEANGDIEERRNRLKPDLDAELASHVHHLSPHPHLPLPPVEPARQLSSSPGPGSVKRTCLDASEVDNSSRATQPTAVGNPTAVRTPDRKADEGHTQRTIIASMADQRNRRMSASNASRMGPPETPGRRVLASPQLFPSLQFSPDLFQTPMAGPATATTFPQNRLFWDSISNPEDLHYQDPFGPPHADLVSPFTPSPVPSHGFQPADSVSSTHAYDLPSSQNTQVLTVPISPSIDDTGFPAPFTASPRVPVPAPEDPSMFLSSPARRFAPAIQPVNAFGSSSRPELQAYHHQIQESKREEELERAKKTNNKRSSNAKSSKNSLKRPVSPPSISNSHPGMKRSSTHSGIGDSHPHQRRQSQVSFADSVSIFDDRTRLSRGGRSSPLKHTSATAYQTSNRHLLSHRTSLSFTIDKDGRAKTVITRVPDRPRSRMDHDQESSGSETDSVDAADFEIARSQNTSFAFPEREDQNRHIDRLRYESKSHSKSSSYSSTIDSAASAPTSSRTSSAIGGFRPKPRLPGDQYAKPVMDAQPRRNFTPSHSQAPHDDETILGTEEESGDAQDALRAILKDRPRSFSGNMAHFPPPSNHLNNAFEQFNSSPPIPHHHHSGYGVFDASPTTLTDPDLASPSTDRGSHASNNSTRCICKSTTPDGQLMIQCESCAHWLHAPCVGISSAYELPPVYICFYCAQTPMRHGRMREPSRPSRAAAMVPTQSPLANKRARWGR